MYPFHPPRSSATQKFLSRLDVHVTFVWMLTVMYFCTLPLRCIPWCFLNWSSFTLCDDFWIYIYLWRWPTFFFNPWFKIHSRPISHSLCIPLSRYDILTFIFLVSEWCSRTMFGVCGVQNLFISVIFQETIWFIILSLDLYLFIFSLLGVHFFSHAYSGSYQVHHTNNKKAPLY